MTEHADWAGLFEGQAKLLEREIETLATELGETQEVHV